jgi:hypothetical protein
MISLSAHGLRSSHDPSRRDFLVTMFGAVAWLGYARSGLASAAAPSLRIVRTDHLCGIDANGAVTINVIRADGPAWARRSRGSSSTSWRRTERGANRHCRPDPK